MREKTKVKGIRKGSTVGREERSEGYEIWCVYWIWPLRVQGKSTRDRKTLESEEKARSSVKDPIPKDVEKPTEMCRQNEG